MATNSLNTITVDGVTYDAAAYAASQTASVKAGDDLGKDAFLQLLVTQLRYQDPLNPQDNSEYIAELANFSSLEQMTNVVKNLEDLGKLVGQLSSMIGKHVDWLEVVNSADAEGNPISHSEKYTGRVTGVTIVEGAPSVVVEDTDGVKHQVDISNIGHVYEDNEKPADETSDDAATNDLAASEVASSTAQTATTSTTSETTDVDTADTADVAEAVEAVNLDEAK